MNGGDDRMEDEVRDGQRRNDNDNNSNNNNAAAAANVGGANAIPEADEPALDGYTRQDFLWTCPRILVSFQLFASSLTNLFMPIFVQIIHK